MSRRDPAPVVLALPALAAALALAGCGGGGGGGGGNALALGKEALVGYQDPSKGGARTKLAITVLAVRKGSQEELKRGGLEVDAKDRDASVYYVDARYKNRGDKTVKRSVSVGLEDSKGNLIGSTLIFGFGGKPFAPCKDVSEGALAPGGSYEDCTLFLVPAGVKVGKVDFLSDEGPGKEPRFVYWNAA